MHENLNDLPLAELRRQWAEVWGIQPHAHIGRKMLTHSLEYKRRESASGGLSPDVQKRLKALIAAYKRNPRYFDEGLHGLKPGTRIVKTWREKRHAVLVTKHGFDYDGKTYTSLSEIASTITGSRWNGWVFFGIKKQARKKAGDK